MKKIVCISIGIFLLTFLFGCGSNKNVKFNNYYIFGNYVFDSPIYISSLSSVSKEKIINDNKNMKCTITNKLFEIYSSDNKFTINNPKYKKIIIDTNAEKAFNIAVYNAISITNYKRRYQYIIYDQNNQKVKYYLYQLDDEIWLASYLNTPASNTDIIFNIFRIKNKDSITTE